ncbi:MAG: hypothetical protein GY894_01980 [Planctomycetes bacterium]|jgi:hypothetical protein|nr:hypothetical protein [Planctomycetota bacterium]MCP4838119.1 hypothetical protein [Planctomycetota bacterium]
MKRLAAIILLAATASVQADSGLVRSSGVEGPWRITIMTDPTPLRQGPIDISVMVQTLDGGVPVLDAVVEFTLLHQDSGTTLNASATRSQADNRLLYAAKFVLPAPASWNVSTNISTDAASETMAWSFTAADPVPPFSAAWPWLLPVPAALLLYGVNRRLHSGRTADAP